MQQYLTALLIIVPKLSILDLYGSSCYTSGNSETWTTCNRKKIATGKECKTKTLPRVRWDSAIHKKSATRKKCNMKRLLHKKGHTGKVGPRTRDVYSQDPETPKCLGGTRDWDPQSGTRGPKISKWNPGISIFYSFNRLFYTLHFTCYKTLHQFVYKINLFMANIQIQPLRCGVNFKELQVVT